MNIVVMFPYPSAEGLHLGHMYNYALVDTYCRWKRLNGFEVNQPFGYDAFGLPAENYARKVGGDPREITYKNIDNFRRQMSAMNTQFSEKLITSDPSYIKWTQWIFTQLLNNNLAYKAYGEVNWCHDCQTVLANEQVKNNACERCASTIVHKQMNQWYFKITNYKDRLINGLDHIDYPESTKKQQKAWLTNLRDWCVSRQRKWGCPIPIQGETDTLDTFVDSSFYYLRYLTDSSTEFLPKHQYKPVDLYIGGQEHACMHLIYARFIHMFLYDIGIVPQEEPFNKVIHQGMITYQGEKMAKSKGNVVNPDDYDPDELRMYLMFIGHYFDGGEWSDNAIIGIRRFLKRLSQWMNHQGSDPIDVQRLHNQLNNYMDRFKFNKVISTLMEFYNNNKGKCMCMEDKNHLLKIMNVFAPNFKLED